MTDLDGAGTPRAGGLPHVPDPLLVTDGAGRVVDANAQARRLFGGRIVGRPVAALLVGEATQARARHDGARRLFALRRVGAPIPVEVTARRQDDAHIVAVRDVSRRWRKERELHRQADLLKATNRELVAFGHAVSHDLRGPLVAMGHTIELLMRRMGDRADAEERLLMDLTAASAHHMAAILEGLATLSAVTETELDPRPTDVAALARMVLERLAREDPRREVRLEAPASLMVQGDARLLAVLVENLVGNAWKFTKGDAVLRLGQHGDDVFFEDDGPGIPADRREEVFRPFYRLHHPEDVAGEGIGLATVQRIVRRHGGWVRVEEAVGGGARFVWRLE